MMRSKFYDVRFRLQRFLAEEAGQDLVEYSLIIALVAVASIASLNGVAASLNTMLHTVIAGINGI